MFLQLIMTSLDFLLLFWQHFIKWKVGRKVQKKCKDVRMFLVHLLRPAMISDQFVIKCSRVEHPIRF
jgi:hypothetical protein